MLAPLLATIAAAIKLAHTARCSSASGASAGAATASTCSSSARCTTAPTTHKADLLHRNEADGFFKIADDPRVTRVGRWLRRTSLDELPQLINVLRGEMSLVGPRPLVDEEDARIEGWFRRRLDVTPGMTGAWQVLGSSRIPLRDMVTIDYLYGANWSLWLDVKILLRTIPHMLSRRGL